MQDEATDPRQGGSGKGEMIACRRTGQLYDISECLRCPYCCADDAQQPGADAKTFCDFHPGVDPLNFGFPGDDDRTLRG